MVQLLLHLCGDYILQSDWMAQNKTKASWPAAVHATLYSLPFFFVFRPTLIAFLTILVTHFFVDRFRLARYVVWGKNLMGPWYRPVLIFWGAGLQHGTATAERTRHWVFACPMPPLAECPTGYPANTPVWLSTWLLIIADNTLHLTINYLALRYL